MRGNIVWLSGEASAEDIDDSVAHNEGVPRYFRIDTECFGRGERSILSIAHKSQQARDVMSALALRGFYLYYNTGTDNRFIRHDRLPFHWPALKSGEFSWSADGVVYKLELPEDGTADSLIVVFSPINSKPRLLRYFWPSFGKLAKFVPRKTAILRVGDVGGVKGAFYLNTVHRPGNAGAISSLIASVVADLKIPRELVVMYGASKGGTGALYHGLVGGWRFVSVDPIVSDVWYESEMNDYHFTASGIFAESKQDVFAGVCRALGAGLIDVVGNSAIVTSFRSPQYDVIRDICSPLMDKVSVFNCLSDRIEAHPDVAPNSIYAQVLALNASRASVALPLGHVDIP